MISIDGSEVRAFADQLRDAPKELRGKLRRNIRKAADDVLQDIRANASWSSRIPDATRISVGFGSRSAGVTIVTDSRKAPHARPLEFGNAPGVNRHPVFGSETWVDQPVRPFFMRAVRKHEPRVVKSVQQAIDDTFNGL